MYYEKVFKNNETIRVNNPKNRLTARDEKYIYRLEKTEMTRINEMILINSLIEKAYQKMTVRSSPMRPS